MQITARVAEFTHLVPIVVYASMGTRDVKTPKFFGPARPVVHFSGPARPVIQFFILGPFGRVWASKNLLSSMF